MTLVDIATYVGTAITLLGVGMGAQRLIDVSRRQLPPPKTGLTDPQQLLPHLNVVLSQERLQRLDIIGYSVHSMFDPLHSLVNTALKSGVRVRFLMLAPDQVSLTERVSLEHPGTDLAPYLARSRASIQRTTEDILGNARTVAYQANLARVSCEVRYYDVPPVYRAVITDRGSSVSSYFDAFGPARDFHMTDPRIESEINGLDANRAANWFDYVWRYRSRPASTKAILFDLYDTLARIPDHSRDEHYREQANILGVEKEEFEVAWECTSSASNSGDYPTTADRFMEIGQLLGIKMAAALAEELQNREHEFLRTHIVYADGVKALLSELRLRGYSTAVVSNCSPSVRAALTDSPLWQLVDAFVFSYEEGVCKPDARIYSHALSRLGTDAQHALFVGDGNDEELTGAQQMGLRIVRAAWFKNSPTTLNGVSSIAALAHRIDGEARWILDD